MANLTNKFLDLAFEQAKINLGSTKQNPSVGCVVEKDGSVISTGYTSKGGRPHAEFNALINGKNFKNTNLYISLEPCSHFGKTPPCVKLILKKKVKKVFFPSKDPNPITSGKSFSILKKSGVKVKSNLNVKRFKEFYESYINKFNKKKLLIDAKIAVSKDFFTKNLKSKWITNSHSRKIGNFLRSEYDILLTTSKTINTDNPLLNCRINGLSNKSPDLFILDRFLKINKKSNIINKRMNRKIYIVTIKEDKKKIYFLRSKKVKVILLKSFDKKKDFIKLLDIISKKGYSRIFVESGVVFLNFLNKNKFLDNLFIFQSSLKLKKKGSNKLDKNFIRQISQKNRINVNLNGNILYKGKLSYYV